MGTEKTLLVLVQVFGFIFLCCAQSYEYCQTPRGTQGECKKLSDCKVLLSILQHRPIKAEDADYLNRSQCGFDGNLPKVCCPLGGDNQGGSSSSAVPLAEPKPVSTNLLPSTDVCGYIGPSNKPYREIEADLNEYPWMALVEYERENGKRGFYCAGVLISKRYILTAAHCIKGKDLPRSWKLVSVRLGEHNTDTDVDCEELIGLIGQDFCAPPPVNVPVEERIAHESYVPEDINQYHDIGLLRLARDVKYSESVQPICLPTTAFDQRPNSTGEKLVVAGWGKTENRSESPVKLAVSVPVKLNTECVNTYRRAGVHLSNSQLCAGGEKGKDSCKGDSGGPLMNVAESETGEIVWYSVGVMSFGPSPCDMEEWPSVYTKVANYVPWIVSKLRP